MTKLFYVKVFANAIYGVIPVPLQSASRKQFTNSLPLLTNSQVNAREHQNLK